MRHSIATLLAALACSAAGCTGQTSPTDSGIDSTADATGGIACLPVNEVQPRATPIEYVGLTVERPLNSIDDFTAVVDPIFGAAAAAGTFQNGYVLENNVLLTVTPDPRTGTQVIARIDMIPSPPADPTARTIVRVPVSFQYGQIFINTVKVAYAQATALWASSPSSTAPWLLEYNSTSQNGGNLTLHVEWSQGHGLLRVITDTPRTLLTPGHVNTPAFVGAPYETVSGTVNFTLDRDEFQFFSDRAYGVTSGAAQNFNDFQLEPHNWLRLTVTPDLTDRLVNVAFDVVTLDGTRVRLAAAPASYVAGEQFQQNVFRLVDNMTAQETATPGSSTPWSSTFYYDDPAGGGVVSVIASGSGGVFSIAYAVQSPTNTLQDVQFVPYQGIVNVPTMLPTPTMQTCAQLGSTDALMGQFNIKFDASSTVRDSMMLTRPLRGDVYGSIYHASDVTIVGPNAGAVSLADFHFSNVDITDPNNLMSYTVPTSLPVGSYQILGFMDINDDADAGNASPDVGEPVTLPIGAYSMQCAVQPVTVEFALLLPPGQ